MVYSPMNAYANLPPFFPFPGNSSPLTIVTWVAQVFFFLSVEEIPHIVGGAGSSNSSSLKQTQFQLWVFFCGWKFCSLIPKYIQLFLAVIELMQIKQYKIIFIDLIFRGWSNHANFGHRNIQWYNSTQFISVCNAI